MHKRHRYLLLSIAIIVVVALSALNVLISIQNRERASGELKQAIEAYRQEDRQVTTEHIADAITQLSVMQGPKGSNGVEGKDGDQGPAGPKGEDGKDGEDGKNGKDARQVVIDTDPLTGDIMWRYADDTLWTLLVEKCELKGVCQ